MKGEFGMAGGTLTLWTGLAGSLALGCVADPVARRDEDPLDAGVADAALVAPVPDAGPVDAAPAPDPAPPRVPECVLEMDDPMTGELLHRCELFERDRLSVCEQLGQCLCIGRLELAGTDWLAGDLIGCMARNLEARGAITLNDYCYGATVSVAVSEYSAGNPDATPVGAGCDSLIISVERALPWPVPADDHCVLTLRDRGTSAERTCPIAPANRDGTCEQVAHCLCAPAFEAENFQNTEYYGCLVRAFFGDFGLARRCGVTGAMVADLPSQFDEELLGPSPLAYDLSTSPGCADVPLDPRSGAAPR